MLRPWRALLVLCPCVCARACVPVSVRLYFSQSVRQSVCLSRPLVRRPVIAYLQHICLSAFATIVCLSVRLSLLACLLTACLPLLVCTLVSVHVFGISLHMRREVCVCVSDVVGRRPTPHTCWCVYISISLSHTCVGTHPPI